MTPLELQNALKKRIEKVVKGFKLNSSKTLQKEILVFEQHLPTKAKSQSRNPETELYPCIIVYLDEGEIPDINSINQVKVFLVIGVYDDEFDNQGYRDAMNVVEKIIQDLERAPVIEKRFEMKHPLKWKYNDEDQGPYYFAWIETNFEIPRSLRDDVEEMI
ncbi:hypothetical protein RJD24_18610 [Bacillaceae bacterium IKA-2]|nr:hypothetical protein RJD24_18610 [Bacillaceae bacterium IKA-2]